MYLENRYIFFVNKLYIIFTDGYINAIIILRKVKSMEVSMGKLKVYTLYAKVEGSQDDMYTINDGINKELKRGQILMYDDEFEKLDFMTSSYSSFDEINTTFQNLHNSTKNMSHPIIFVDELNSDMNIEKNLFYTTDVVYAEDAKELEDRENIKYWLFDYLFNNSENISDFRVIRDIYENVKNYYKTGHIGFWVNKAVEIYLVNEGYKGYREAYFKLKELDPERKYKKEK